MTTVTRNLLNNELSNLAKRNNVSSLEEAGAKLQNQLEALVASKFLETDIGKEIGGFTSLIASTTPVVQLTNDPEGVRALKTLSDKSALQTLTGSTIEPDLGAEIIALGTPQSVTNALADHLGVHPSVVTSVGEGIANGDTLDKVASTIVANVSNSIFERFAANANRYVNGLINGINVGFNQPIKDIVESKTDNLLNVVTKYGDRKAVPSDVFSLIANLVDTKEFLAAAKLMVPYTTYDIGTIETEFSQLDLTVSGNTTE